MPDIVLKKSQQRLYEKVITRGFCTLCGACIGYCPYFQVNPLRGNVRMMDPCDVSDGQCYQYCPRTRIDMDTLHQDIFGVPFDEARVGIGIVRDIFLARSTDQEILRRGQDGGVVTTLLWTAMSEGIIDGAVETTMSDDKSPHGFLARNRQELLQCVGNSYEPGATLEALNQIPAHSKEKVAIVGLPCQVQAVAKMRVNPPKNRLNIHNVKLVLGLFCGWAFSPGVFHQYLNGNFNLSQVKKFDIPHHPAHSFDVYTSEGKQSIELDEVRDFINPACSYCGDMTSQFADISVGSGRTKFRGWNTVIVRTENGEKLVKIAKRRGMLETQPIPEESVTNLKRAALNKMKRAITSITERTGSSEDLGYLILKPVLRDKLCDEKE